MDCLRRRGEAGLTMIHDCGLDLERQVVGVRETKYFLAEANELTSSDKRVDKCLIIKGYISAHRVSDLSTVSGFPSFVR